MDSTIFIDSSNITTEMCVSGGNYNTDKSPLSLNCICGPYHRKGYTAIYSMLFSPFRHQKITFGEIGIEGGCSLKMWSDWFYNADINAFEYHDFKIEYCKQLNIPKVNYYKTNVENTNELNNSFLNLDKQFDIIIDDSTHIIEHQNNIINITNKYLKPGGILIIEDIHRDELISSFIIDKSIWNFSTFIICHHSNRNCFNNDKILYLVKK